MWGVVLLLAASSATAGQPEGGEEAALARLSPELRLMLNTSLYTSCRSRTGSQVPQMIYILKCGRTNRGFQHGEAPLHRENFREISLTDSKILFLSLLMLVWQGVTCPGFHLGDECLQLYLWCREDFSVQCGPHGLRSNNQLFCSNKK